MYVIEVFSERLLTSCKGKNKNNNANYTVEKLGNTLGNENYHHQRGLEEHHEPQMCSPGRIHHYAV